MNLHGKVMQHATVWDVYAKCIKNKEQYAEHTK